MNGETKRESLARTSLYFQIIRVVGIGYLPRSLQIEDMDFDVFHGEAALT